MYTMSYKSISRPVVYILPSPNLGLAQKTFLPFKVISSPPHLFPFTDRPSCPVESKRDQTSLRARHSYFSLTVFLIVSSRLIR